MESHTRQAIPLDTIDEDFIHRLPKTDLHIHLDGSLRVETLLDLAQRQKIQLPADDPERLEEILVQAPDRCGSLEQYLRAFDITLSVLQQPEALTRAAYELAADNAAENVRYLEVRFSPILHQKDGLNLTTIVDAVREGLTMAENEFGIESGIIICGMRSMNPSVSLRLAQLTVDYKGRGVVAFDLAGGEIDNPAKDHREAFYLILNNNVNCTVHAGESYGPASIHQALHYCGAHRLGHGTRLLENGDLLDYVNDHRIPIECCITSNIQTGAIQHFCAHPIRYFYDRGLRVTVNTDNRLMSGTTMTQELMICVEKLGFDAQGIRDLIVDGFKSAFLPHKHKKRMLEKITAELDKLYSDGL